MSWMELPEDDQPAEQIWLDQEAVSAHFDMVRDRYRAQADGDTIGDPNTWGDNEYTKSLREG